MHLQEVHKFGECNHTKKYFRADHFRQHLRHNHAGTSGKWTNMLENACMKDEPLPDPIRRSEQKNQGVSLSYNGASDGWKNYFNRRAMKKAEEDRWHERGCRRV